MRLTQVCISLTFILIFPFQSFAAMGGADTPEQALAESALVNDAVDSKDAPAFDDSQLLPWDSVKTWGKYLPEILDSLEDLKNHALDTDEWEDYRDFYKRCMKAALVLRKGEPVYSGRATGYLYVLVQSYVDLLKSEGFQEDLAGPLGGGSFADGRTELVQNFQRSTEQLMAFLLSSKQVEIIDGEYRLILSTKDSIVRNFSEVLISVAEDLLNQNIDLDFKAGLEWMIAQVTTISEMKGGDGSRNIDEETVELINWYDVWNSSEFDVFDTLTDNFAKSKKVTKTRKGKFRALADAIDHMTGSFETIKNHVGYGVDFSDRTEEDALNDFFEE